ncbi:unnamed protein product, partial [Didymodactylos carnosus]
FPREKFVKRDFLEAINALFRLASFSAKSNKKPENTATLSNQDNDDSYLDDGDDVAADGTSAEQIA